MFLLLIWLLTVKIVAGQGDYVPIQVNGIFPGLSSRAESSPVRSEAGIGALMPWADRLWMVTYLSVHNAGSGTGLYEIFPNNLTMVQREEHNCTYANRLLHAPTNQIIIGPYIIDSERNIRTITDLLSIRIASVSKHIIKESSMVYFLSMDGGLYECDVTSDSDLKITLLYNLVETLDIDSSQGEQPHFKASHTVNNTLYVTSNTFEEADFIGTQHGGRFASWNGTKTNGSSSWTIIEKTAFVEVTSRYNFGRVVYAVGWDNVSAILMTLDVGDSSAHSTDPLIWRKYRLPKASHAFDHLWQTEWPRIREVETERYLADIHGMFYELSPLGWAGSTWGLRPISQHLRVIPDFTSFRGMLVLGGNQVSSIMDNNWVTGQSQSGLYFGKTDDLWSFGKPQGWGGVWRKHVVQSGVGSDPFLMTGFDKKTLHITVELDSVIFGDFDNVRNKFGSDKIVYFAIEVDFTGIANGGVADNDYVLYQNLSIDLGQGGYGYHVFPSGFSAHWVRIVPSHDCIATAIFHYT